MNERQLFAAYGLNDDRIESTLRDTPGGYRMWIASPQTARPFDEARLRHGCQEGCPQSGPDLVHNFHTSAPGIIGEVGGETTRRDGRTPPIIEVVYTNRRPEASS